MRQPSEEEIRALEAEMEKLTVDDVLLQTIVTLINIGARKAGLAELMVACVAQALREIDAGETPPDLPPRLIEENMWRAIRHGQDGRLLDLEAERIEEFPAAEALDRLKAWTGADIALPELNGAQRQRRMIDAGASPFEVYAKCVEETRATYETAV